MAALAFLFAHNSRIVFPGGVSERPKVLASKASVGKTTAGSNPAATATSLKEASDLRVGGSLLSCLYDGRNRDLNA